MKIYKRAAACAVTAMLAVLAVVPVGAIAAQTLNPDGTITLNDPDNPNSKITIPDPNGDGRISIADSTAILQFLGGYNYNTEEQVVRI